MNVASIGYSPPDGVRISMSASAPEVREGDTIVVVCQTEANPRVENIVWRRLGDASFEQKHKELNITSAQPADAGTYTCHATNRLTPTDSAAYTYTDSKEIQLNVLCTSPLQSLGT